MIPMSLIAGTALVLVVVLLAANIYGRYLRIPRGKGVLVFLACLLASIGLGIYRHQQFVGHGLEDKDVIAIISACLLPWAAIPFLAKLYLAWIAGAATDAEKAPGREGVRAWLRGGNLVCAIMISDCLWLSFGYSFLTTLALTVMALLAYPLFNMAATSPESPAPATDTLSPERERVLKMLDDGKITAQESAELLNALPHSVPARAPQCAPAPYRKMVWLGLALLLIGFFFPWFVVKSGDLQQAMNEAMSRMPMLQGMPNPAGMMSQGMTTGVTLYVAGGDIAHGLGWCVLLLGIVAAALPFVAVNLDSQTCQKACLIALGAGAIILLYLLTQSFRFVGIGLLLGLAGYALEFIGVLKARRLDWGRAL